MNMHTFEHFLITRFNVGIYSDWSLNKHCHVEHGTVKPTMSADEWTRHRMALFKAYTVPSVRNQDTRKFTWILGVDSHTPRTFVDELTALTADLDCALYMTDGQMPLNNIRLLVDGMLDHVPDVMITTRIDSDDAMGPGHMSEVQRLTLSGVRGIIDPAKFLLYHSPKFQMYEWRPNSASPFLSMVEDTHGNMAKVYGCYTLPHFKMNKRFRPLTRMLPDRATAMMVVHEHNLRNRIGWSPTIRGQRYGLLGRTSIERLRDFNIEIPSGGR